MTTLEMTALQWAVAMFGEVAKDRKERAMRLFEEVAELAQACDVSADTLSAITQRVYSKPTGDLLHELRQVAFTLETFAENENQFIDTLVVQEGQRVQRIPKEEWLRRHQEKAEAGTAKPVTESTDAFIKQFVQDRNDALLSLDLEKINAYMRKYTSPELPDNEIGWAAIHKARTGIVDFPEEEAEKSKLWLREHNMSPFIRVHGEN